eukprot:XP_001704314.1 Hypothetical protein GL50803_123336 [Giardia lamblia ATCC 50803]
MKCLSGYLSIDSLSCQSQCDGPNQQGHANGKSVCECIAGAYLEGCVQCDSARLEWVQGLITAQVLLGKVHQDEWF